MLATTSRVVKQRKHGKEPNHGGKPHHGRKSKHDQKQDNHQVGSKQDSEQLTSPEGGGKSNRLTKRVLWDNMGVSDLEPGELWEIPLRGNAVQGVGGMAEGELLVSLSKGMRLVVRDHVLDHDRPLSTGNRR